MISSIWAQAGSSEQSWRAIEQLRAVLEGPGVTKPEKKEIGVMINIENIFTIYLFINLRTYIQ